MDELQGNEQVLADESPEPELQHRLKRHLRVRRMHALQHVIAFGPTKIRMLVDPLTSPAATPSTGSSRAFVGAEPELKPTRLMLRIHRDRRAGLLL